MGARKLSEVTLESIDTDSYYIQCRQSIASSKEFTNVLKDVDLRTADTRLKLYLDLKNIQGSDSEDLKMRIAENLRKLPNHTGRAVADIVFHEMDFRHGNQVFGRDVKRWAAILIGDVFSSRAVIGDVNGLWDFWHE